MIKAITQIADSVGIFSAPPAPWTPAAIVIMAPMRHLEAGPRARDDPRASIEGADGASPSPSQDLKRGQQGCGYSVCAPPSPPWSPGAVPLPPPQEPRAPFYEFALGTMVPAILVVCVVLWLLFLRRSHRRGAMMQADLSRKEEEARLQRMEALMQTIHSRVWTDARDDFDNTSHAPGAQSPREATAASSTDMLPESREQTSTSGHPDDSSQQSCAICLEAYVAGDVLRLLPCHHTFHQRCIDQWLLRLSRKQRDNHASPAWEAEALHKCTCPLCKGAVFTSPTDGSSDACASVRTPDTSEPSVVEMAEVLPSSSSSQSSTRHPTISVH